jgi:SAM-dependent methyltransferase
VESRNRKLDARRFGRQFTSVLPSDKSLDSINDTDGVSLILHEIAESGHRILNPFTDEKLMELATVSRVSASTRVLDLACGKGEMLARWAQELGCSGLGVDISETFVTAARARADALGVAKQVVIELGNAREYVTEPEAFDVGACIGATWLGDGVPGTVELLRPAIAPGGLLLIGEPYWREPPPAETRRALAGDEEAFDDLAGLLERFESAGTELVEMVLADGHSWDRYVAAQWWTLREWLDAHPDDALREDVERYLDHSRRRHLTYRRRYLGWGVFVLRPAR